MAKVGIAIAVVLPFLVTPAFAQQYGSYSQTYINGNPVGGYQNPSGVTLQVGPNGVQAYPNNPYNGSVYGVQQPGVNRTTVYPNIPGTNLPNLSQPGYIVDTLPNGTQNVYPVAPGNNTIAIPGYNRYPNNFQQGVYPNNFQQGVYPNNFQQGGYPSVIQPAPNASYGLRQPSVNNPASSGMRQP